MSTETPEWLLAVREADDASERLRREAEEVADRRAHAIARGVAAAGRGGRPVVAAQMRVTVGVVDRALARAKANPRPSAGSADARPESASIE
ncbi:hypothetical protein [Streptomyces sp. NPDC094049]|uniref:hypothetical protein n=1 Tax=Streptomyces sp. NPDC094049 TaxID=3154987 RepID=UPI00332B6223